MTLCVTLVNRKIEGGTSRLAMGTGNIEQRIAVGACKLMASVGKARGRQREKLLNGVFHLFVKDNEAQSFHAMSQKTDQLEAKLLEKSQETQQLIEQLGEKDEEIAILLEEMEMELSHPDHLSPTFGNKGKQIHNLSPRQQRRKLSDCKSFIQQALWFCETFGLTPHFINLKKTATGSPVKMALSSPTCTTTTTCSPTEEVDNHSKVCQMLYILDRFAVSDEAYHELSSSSDLPPLHHIKQKRLALNSTVEIQRLPGIHQGAYCPVTGKIQEQVTRTVIIIVIK